MSINVTRNDIYWTYLSQILQVSAGFFILPLLLVKLTSSELAIWYIFMSITALVNLLDFGLQPTIMRNVSYVFEGATSLKKEGLVLVNNYSDVDYSLLKKIIQTVKKIYGFLSVVIGLLLITVGSIYLRYITRELVNSDEIFLAWNIFSVSIIINFYFYYYTPLLLGRGYISKSHKTIVFSKLSFLIISGFAVYFGFGLIGLASANLLGSLVNRFLSYIYFFDNDLKYKLSSVKRNTDSLLNIFWYNSYKSGLVSIGSFLILKGNYFILSAFVDLNLVARFAITLQVITFIRTISSSFFTANIPMFNKYRINNDFNQLKILFSKSVLIAISVFIIGGLVLIIFGNQLLLVVKSNTFFLNYRYMIVILIIMLLEQNHSICATLITTKNIVPFVKSALLSGLFIIVSSFVLIYYFNLQIWGVVLSQGLVQLIYNNWKWPYEVAKEFNKNYFIIIYLGAIYFLKRKLKYFSCTYKE